MSVRTPSGRFSHKQKPGSGKDREESQAEERRRLGITRSKRVATRLRK